MKRLIFALLLVVTVVAGVPGAANAGIVWCRTDPVVTIGGHEVHIVATGTEGTSSTQSNKMPVPDEIFVRYPVGVSYAFVAGDGGLGGYGQNVNHGALGSLSGSNGGTIQVQVRVFIKTFGTHPVLVQIGSQYAEGTSNTWVTLNATISGNVGEPAVLGGDGVCCN